MNSETESTTLISETYSKKSALTALRVLWSGATRQWNKGQCSRWYFTFNGTECSNPGTIESVKYTYYYDASSVDLHSPFTVQGTCVGLPAGDIILNFAVSYCSGYSGANAATGWGTASNMMAEEIFLDTY
ncbi:collagen triple helix repeat-containing protein 1 [Lingula anatina]|uniref:Collagen triple helix repeat-containing protein 1 n=1 Tax=Lingula anatina TaxID=7574 RepID=A0A1S3HR40_LINAN|nr:collagen triple helix repeat-containing protein 1 [Lingula anatina]|eukprot:XP_013387514.1 collagen triple helix repeat-containing protein 1 [Lingula anatina]